MESATLLTVAELADALAVTKEHVYDLARAARIPHYRVGAAYRFDLAEVLDALRSEPDPAVA